ncbi:hypothetical protein I553_9418 [Mycobacterium xenopi 4042]|uniref:Uncharacterized protein n=1 Tax=Mycobacterium xenopi 4042 TaxID=1299334 RepID=X8DXA4_MYCXE|nr:hypothetical protein I552_1260 [Mycobacterium xenopi 3993]EUA73262.1 hypothetical protein I553_9418 [Mycobacterium xenopi 4042]
MGGARGAEDVEGVLRERQLGVDDGLTAHVTQSRCEAARLFDGDQRIVAAVQHEKWWRIRGNVRDR